MQWATFDRFSALYMSEDAMSKIFYTYECLSCKKTSRVEKDDPIPYCCGNIMQRIDNQAPPKSDPNEAKDMREPRKIN